MKPSKAFLKPIVFPLSAVSVTHHRRKEDYSDIIYCHKRSVVFSLAPCYLPRSIQLLVPVLLCPET